MLKNVCYTQSWDWLHLWGDCKHKAKMQFSAEGNVDLNNFKISDNLRIAHFNAAIPATYGTFFRCLTSHDSLDPVLTWVFTAGVQDSVGLHMLRDTEKVSLWSQSSVLMWGWVSHRNVARLILLRSSGLKNVHIPGFWLEKLYTQEGSSSKGPSVHQVHLNNNLIVFTNDAPASCLTSGWLCCLTSAGRALPSAAMSAKAISEQTGKEFLYKHISASAGVQNRFRYANVTPETDWDCLAREHPWLQTEVSFSQWHSISSSLGRISRRVGDDAVIH